MRCDDVDAIDAFEFLHWHVFCYGGAVLEDPKEEQNRFQDHSDRWRFD
jgi:hypothetical protein